MLNLMIMEFQITINTQKYDCWKRIKKERNKYFHKWVTQINKNPLTN